MYCAFFLCIVDGESGLCNLLFFNGLDDNVLNELELDGLLKFGLTLFYSRCLVLDRYIIVDCYLLINLLGSHGSYMELISVSCEG